MTRDIPLYGKKAAGRVAYVSDDKYKRVMAYRWHVKERQRPNGSIEGPYAVTSLPRVRVGGRIIRPRLYMHTLITGWPLTDHEDGNPLNNTDDNLRKSTQAGNQHNQKPRPGTSSVFKGVCWDRQYRKWQVTIQVNGKKIRVGRYLIEADAARAYNAAAIKLHGDFARLNVIEEGA